MSSPICKKKRVRGVFNGADVVGGANESTMGFPNTENLNLLQIEKNFVVVIDMIADQ